MPRSITKQEALEIFGIDIDNLYFAKSFKKSDVDDIQPPNSPTDKPKAPMSEQLLEAVNNMLVHNPNLNPVHAARWLMTTTQGQAFLSQHKTERNIPMERIDYTDLAKAQDGMETICKRVMKGETDITEHEFTAALMEYAKSHKLEKESQVSAFARHLETNPEFAKAHMIVQGQPQRLGSSNNFDLTPPPTGRDPNWQSGRNGG